MVVKLNLNDACKQQHEDYVRQSKVYHPFLPGRLMYVSEMLRQMVEVEGEYPTRANYEQFRTECPHPQDDYMFGFSLGPQMEFSMFTENYQKAYAKNIEDRLEDVIAKAFMYLMDVCAFKGIDIEKAIAMRSLYDSINFHSRTTNQK